MARFTTYVNVMPLKAILDIHGKVDTDSMNTSGLYEIQNILILIKLSL